MATHWESNVSRDSSNDGNHGKYTKNSRRKIRCFSGQVFRCILALHIIFLQMGSHLPLSISANLDTA